MFAHFSGDDVRQAVAQDMLSSIPLRAISASSAALALHDVLREL